jgi:hypothetical protein
VLSQWKGLGGRVNLKVMNGVTVVGENVAATFSSDVNLQGVIVSVEVRRAASWMVLG